MNVLQICMLIVGLLSIITCVLYARTYKFNRWNNLPSIALYGVVSVIISILGIIYPSWWILWIACCLLLFLYIWFETKEDKKKRQKAMYTKWYKSKIYKATLETLGWIIFITEFSVSIIMITTLDWLTTLLFFPITAFALLVMGSEINTLLKKLWTNTSIILSKTVCIILSFFKSHLFYPINNHYHFQQLLSNSWNHLCKSWNTVKRLFHIHQSIFEVHSKKSLSCETIKVTPLNHWSINLIVSFDHKSKWLVGSSIIITWGFFNNILVNATLAISHQERDETLWFIFSTSICKAHKKALASW